MTRELFQFIGSEQTEGVDTYAEPENRRWRWGSDDSSHAIRSLQVQSPRIVNQSNARLIRIIGETKKIAELRERLDYLPQSGAQNRTRDKLKSPDPFIPIP